MQIKTIIKTGALVACLSVGLQALATSSLVLDKGADIHKSGKVKSLDTKPKAKSGVKVLNVANANRVDVTIDGKAFTSYRWVDSVYKPVLWPIYSPAGEPITRGWPMAPRSGERIDHPHHVGHWFNHGDVNGHDFWNNSNHIGPEHKGPFGKIVHRKVESCTGGAAKGTLVIDADWLDKDGKPMLIERATFVFTKVTASKYTITRSSVLTAVNGPVLFRDNKEGMFALRLCRELEQPSLKPEVYTDAQGVATSVPVLNNEGVTGRYISSAGVKGDSVWGTRANWVKMAGQIKGKSTAVTISDDAKNPGSPTYWHARGYGLFSANPLGEAVFSNGAKRLDFQLRKGQSRTFKFTITVENN